MPRALLGTVAGVMLTGLLLNAMARSGNPSLAKFAKYVTAGFGAYENTNTLA